MNEIETKIKSLLEEKGKNFSWLADQIGYSRQGLKSGLEKKKLKLDALEEVAKVLEVNPVCFFKGFTELLDFIKVLKEKLIDLSFINPYIESKYNILINSDGETNTQLIDFLKRTEIEIKTKSGVIIQGVLGHYDMIINNLSDSEKSEFQNIFYKLKDKLIRNVLSSDLIKLLIKEEVLSEWEITKQIMEYLIWIRYPGTFNVLLESIKPE